MIFFLKEAFIYAIPLFLARAVGLILLPIYSRQLEPGDFGFIEFFTAISSILMVILPLEIGQAVARFIPETDDKNRQGKIISSAIGFTLMVCVIFVMGIFLFKSKIFEFFNIQNQYQQYINIIIIYFLTLPVVYLIQIYFRFTNQAKLSISINLTIVLLNLFFVLIFSKINQFNVSQYFYSQIIANLFGILFGLIIINNKNKISLNKFDIKTLKDLLSYSFPLVLSSVGFIALGVVDKIMIGTYVGLTELGFYGVASRISSIVGLGFYVIGTVLTPIAYRDYKKEETKTLILNVFNYTSYASLFLLTCILLFSDILIGSFSGDKYLPASDYIFYLVLSVILGNYYIFFLGMDIEKNTKLLSKINLISGIFGVILCVILVPIFSVWGGIISTILANLFRLLMHTYYSQIRYYLPIKVKFFCSLFFGLIIIKSLI